MANWGGGFNVGFESIMHYTLKYARVFAGQPEEVAFWHLEAESSIRLDAIQRATDRGVSRIVGYRATITLYIPVNTYATLLGDMEVLRSAGELTDIQIGMGTAIHDPIETSGVWYPDLSGADTPGALSAGDKAETLMGCRLTNYTIETIERRPRGIVTIEAMYSTRLFEDGIRHAFFGTI